MALALSSCPRLSQAASRRPAPRRSRATTVVVKAVNLREASDWVAQAFVRIFSPDDSKIEHYPTNSGWQGRIDHTRKPFKDNFVSNAPLPPSSTLEPTERQTEKEEGTAGYVEKAVKDVVAGIPSGNPDEPEWPDATGWRGDLHKSDNKRDSREGFHTKRY
ncbi:hypothetical protein Agub_g11460 [Astrephomene gubernaculifera]|uniref:Uncharacterized protein n=1 Tax=Astrephomene gubernaculifera TaxID=47775 RepID=A0AAD3DX03_9CHLO|nr:hypothetical protein Agub_g11460 [Astrephomene gubernaculifera]